LEVKDVALKILPSVTKILGVVKLFVDLAWLVISEISAGGPSSCEGPVSLARMPLKLMDSLA